MFFNVVISVHTCNTDTYLYDDMTMSTDFTDDGTPITMITDFTDDIPITMITDFTDDIPITVI